MSEEITTEDKELEELEDAILAAVETPEAEEEESPAEVPEKVEEQEEETSEEEPEQKPEEDAAPEAEEESEEEKPDNSAWARMRHEQKKLKEQLAALQKPEVPEGETADSSMDKLTKVWETGDGDEASLLANIRKASSTELAAIYDKAVAGQYGDFAEDVIKTVSESMTFAKAREDREAETARTRSEAIRKAYDDELDMAKSDFPDMAKEDSEGAKFFSEFMTGIAGTLNLETGELDGAGELPEELSMYLHTHPYVAHQLANKVFNAQSKNSDASKAELSKLNKEMAAIKERLAKYESVEVPSSSAGADDVVDDDDLEALEKEIFKAAGVS